MSLKFVVGPSGSGKSYKMCKEMVDISLENLSNSLIAIVPEQFTMQTQKDIVMMHPNKGTMNIDILSFDRLAYRVFEELGWKNPELLDDTGKNLILRRVIDKNADNLQVYKDRSRSVGFVEEMKSVISELYQYNIDDEKFDKMLEIASSKPVLSKKLKDINFIYKCFKEETKEKYTTKEALLDILARLVPLSKIIKSSEIYIDGFTGFTPVQYSLLAMLIRYAKNVTVALTIDYKECGHLENPKEFELFALSKQTINRLSKIAAENNISVEGLIAAGNEGEKTQIPYRFANSKMLAHLEAAIFRLKKPKAIAADGDIRLISCEDASSEAEKVAIEINKLVKKEGYRYRDIAVITSDSEIYNAIIRDIFEINDIPAFIDLKRRLKSNPLMAGILAALKAVESKFSYEDVFNYLKSGMCAIERKDLFSLENYARAKGIKGKKKWESEWIKASPDGDDIEKLNEIRIAAISDLIGLYDALKGHKKTVKELTKRLYDFAVKMDFKAKVEKFEEEAKLSGKAELASEYEQVYRLLIEFFDKLVDLNGDEKLSLSDYIRLVESGFEELKCGVIPSRVDQVVVGDLQRTRLKDIKALFFVGVNDGRVPKINSSSGLLTQNDKKLLEVGGIELSPTNVMQSYIQRFYLYLAMTKPSKKLVITYSRLDEESNEAEASSIVKGLKRMFTGLEEEIYFDFDFKDVSSPALLKKYIAKAVAAYAKGEKCTSLFELLDLMGKDENFKNYVEKAFKAAFYERLSENLNSEIAKLLFGERIMGGVSRFEAYASCAFEHFLQYGLKLKKRQQFEIEMSDFGNIIHNSLKTLSEEINKSDMTWGKLDLDIVNKMADKCVDEEAKTMESIEYLDSARDKYMLNRAKRILKRTVSVLDNQASFGKFTPSKFEFEFYQSLKDVDFKGRIDRIDYSEENDQILVKVIDYKTGAKEFNIIDAYYGTELQLLTYMGVAMEKAKEAFGGKMVIPAGLYYFEAKDPYVKFPEDRINVFRMKGMTNADKDILTAIDNSFEKDCSVDSKVVEAKKSVNKDGTEKLAGVYDSEDFEDLIDYVREKIDVFGREIKSGKIEVNPFVEENDGRLEEISCKYCIMRNICAFGESEKECRYRVYEKQNNADAMEKIKQAKK